MVVRNRTLLNEIATKVGSRYGYKDGDVTAEWSRFRDFKVKWVRGWKFISLEVSDYLPDDCIEPLMEYVFEKIQTGTGEMSPEVYTRLKEDCLNLRDLRASRFLGAEYSSVLTDELRKKGIVGPDTVVFENTRSHRVCEYSAMFDMLVVSEMVLSEDMDAVRYKVSEQQAKYNEKMGVE